MDDQMIMQIGDSLNELDAALGRIYSNLKGCGSLTAEILARAIQEDCPDVPMETLVADCEELRSGIDDGMSFADRMLTQTDEEQLQSLSDFLDKELSGMHEEQKRQYLLVLYQVLSERCGRRISSSEAIQIANEPASIIRKKAEALMLAAREELTAESAEFLNDGIRKLQMPDSFPESGNFSQGDNSWILAAAVYIRAQENQIEKIPARLIGENTGVAVSCAKSLSEVIWDYTPSILSALAVAATCAVAFFAIKAILANSLFLSVMSWAQAHIGAQQFRIVMILGVAQVLQTVGEKLSQLHDCVYNGAAALMARQKCDYVMRELPDKLSAASKDIEPQNDVFQDAPLADSQWGETLGGNLDDVVCES